MKRYRSLKLCAALLLSATWSCGSVDETETIGQSDKPIINGTACDERVHETAVALLMEGDMSLGFGGTFPMRTVMCTGTLIAPDVVLTAAHCLSPELATGGFGTINNVKMYVSFTADLSALAGGGATGLPGQPPNLQPLPADAIEATALIKNPGFNLNLLQQQPNGPTNLFDVGLLFLSRTVDDRQPAIVITPQEVPQLVTGAEVRIAGWGQQSAAPANPFQPPPAGSVGRKICATSTINEIGTHEMQIGAGPETSRKCHGDSGGPTYLDIDTDLTHKERVVGITSHAYDVTDCAKGGVDTRVDVWFDWLDQELNKGCTTGGRVWCEVPGIIPPEFYEPEPEPDPDPVNPIDPTDPVDPIDPGVDQGGCNYGAGANLAYPASVLLMLLAFATRRR